MTSVTAPRLQVDHTAVPGPGRGPDPHESEHVVTVVPRIRPDAAQNTQQLTTITQRSAAVIVITRSWRVHLKSPLIEYVRSRWYQEAVTSQMLSLFQKFHFEQNQSLTPSGGYLGRPLLTSRLTC